jgi:predicted membrane-bound spermidine synthase
MGRARTFAGIALLSAGVLVLQLALTRLFSATMHYHFAFLAISLALFGSGAGGVFVYLAGPRLERAPTERWLARGALLCAASTAVALVVVLQSPVSTVATPGAIVRALVAVYAATALPFFFAGAVVALAVTRFASEISRLYLFDLAGAAAGCLLLIPALDRLGAVDTVLAVAVVATVAAALFAEPRRRGAYALVAAGMAALVLANARTHRLDVRQAKGLSEEGRILFSKWNSFSRVTVRGALADPVLLIMLDADAATVVTRDASDPDPAVFADRVEALAYRLRPGGRALIIGAGGGNDVIMARLYGAREVTAVELNPIVARDVMSSEPFRSYSGDLYRQPGVRLVVDEARSFIRRSGDRYDVIQGTMVDTWAATAAGAFALAENNLYTVEAFGDYLDHLGDDGLLSMTRWYIEPPDQLLRLVSLARAALAERGIVDAASRVMVIRGVPEGGEGGRAAATFLLKKTPFTEDEVRRVERTSAGSSFQVLYTPRSRPVNVFTSLLEAADPRPVWNSLESDVAPTRDNNPFFFQSLRVRNALQAMPISPEWRKTNLGVFVLVAVMAISLVVTVLFVLGPLALLRAGLLRRDTGVKLGYLVYFACLGAGFIVVEVALVQKSILFLGHPVYSLSVVLFSLLLATGVGSRLSGGLAAERLPRALPPALAGIALLVVLYAVGLSPVFYALVHLSRPARIGVTVSLLAPLGLAMGVPMPGGIRILAARAPEIVPWAWGVNGAASVLGSVLALLVAMLAGFDQALLLAAALYALAGFLMRSLALR